jgi:IS5 family transposase
VLALTEQAGELLTRSVREAKRLARTARGRARCPGAQRKLAPITRLEEFIDRAERVTAQIKQRLAGERIADRLVSMFDPDARPIRKGKLGKPTEFGYVLQICEVTQNTRRGARGFILPAATRPGNPGENKLLPDTVSELARLGLTPREIALDGGFEQRPTREALEPLDPERVFIAGRQQPGSRRTQRRLARYRTGAEGRISHLKRSYGLRRTRLKGQEGMKTWTAWSILTYNLDTLAIRAS